MDKKPSSFKHNRKIGQNFLMDTNYIDLMLDQAALKAEDCCLEVGPGQGVLTRKLLEKTEAKKIYALEVDKRLSPYLEPLAEKNPRLSLLWGDAVRFDYTLLEPSPTQMIANIPYHITTPLLWKILEDLAPRGLYSILLMVQKEAALRLQAAPKTKERYPLGITLEAMGKVTVLRSVPPQAFYPRPRVDSAILHIQLEQRRELPGVRTWRTLLSRAFAQRRKTLYNNLKGYLPSKEDCGTSCTAAGISHSSRAEELSTEAWLRLHE
ncbi:MAG TPA: 16S rRNA (adenine(1518)-N(6)/adenine(1519)-N(6))-dimethyltransferase RsmA, partial [Synergistaceae bacterium]|nr:16S rRNA (adenine(1518)-N(6)/adenine(1519)-N(6))-dimethyltransferase RsmA [Synergistaceae bacterium]